MIKSHVRLYLAYSDFTASLALLLGCFYNWFFNIGSFHFYLQIRRGRENKKMYMHHDGHAKFEFVIESICDRVIGSIIISMVYLEYEVNLK